jgi:hypothetical protein
MSHDVFCKSLQRVVEHREVVARAFPDSKLDVVFCGMGEPLLHPRVTEYVRRATDAGLGVYLSSNGSLLDEVTGRALLDAGLEALFLNIGEYGDAYDATYRLPFEQTRDRVTTFAELAEERCQVIAVIVDHRGDPGHVAAVRDYWSALGIVGAHIHPLNNRGGSLAVEHMQYQDHPHVRQAWDALDGAAGTPMCEVPFYFMFIGYDGRYHLCSSDWEKRTDLGSVFDRSLVDATSERVGHVAKRSPVCRTCCHDPTNRLAEVLGAGDSDDLDASETDHAERLALRVAVAHDAARRLGAHIPAGTRPGTARTRIPIAPA